jgi:hypothetical protein
MWSRVLAYVSLIETKMETRCGWVLLRIPRDTWIGTQRRSRVLVVITHVIHNNDYDMYVSFGYVLLVRFILLTFLGFMHQGNARVVPSIWLRKV